MYNCIAIDDEPLALSIITQFCNRRGDIALSTFSNPIEGCKAILQQQPNIVLLDIEMNEISGLDIAKKLSSTTQLIFSTAFVKYALDGYDLNATDFLHKPFSATRFNQAIDRAITNIETLKKAESSQDSAKLTIKCDYKNRSIPLFDILYIESMENYVKIHTISGETIITISSLKTLINTQLPADQFIRIHKSYIVPISKITHHTSRTLTLNGDITLPISRSYKIL